MMLTEGQKTIVGERILAQMPHIEQSSMSEKRKLLCIGKIVDAAIDDFRPIYRVAIQPIQPSILPDPDDVTIDKMAQTHIILQKSGKSEPVQAFLLDRILHMELKVQKEDRPMSQ